MRQSRVKERKKKERKKEERKKKGGGGGGGGKSRLDSNDFGSIYVGGGNVGGYKRKV